MLNYKLINFVPCNLLIYQFLFYKIPVKMQQAWRTGYQRSGGSLTELYYVSENGGCYSIMKPFGWVF